MKGWRIPAIAIVLGLTLISVAAVDYAHSSRGNKGIAIGPFSLPFPGTGIGASGRKRVAPGTTGAPGAAGHFPVGSRSPLPGDLKGPIVGLIDRQGMPSQGFYSVIDAYVVNVTWASLQPTQGGTIASGNAIDRAIGLVRKANQAGAHLALKLRIFSGISAPGWAKTLGGAPYVARDPHSGASGTVGRFWTPAFGQAYQDLERKLAARYDTVPEIREVTMSRCTTIYDEPMIRQIGDPATVARMAAAGYTVAADQSCQKQQIQAHAVWLHTRSDLSFNPYQEVLSARQVATNESFTEQLMSYCRQVLASRCILENNSLRSVTQGSGYDQMYAALVSHGPNISFQTATMQNVGSLSATLMKAAFLDAVSVELPSGYQSMGLATFAAPRAQLASELVR